ncbi:MAG: TOBE domain-containing protein [Nocardioides sp.]
MNDGHAVDFGSPTEIYEHPRDLFSAQFVSGANTLHAVVTGVEGGRVSLVLGGTEARIDALVPLRAEQPRIGDKVVVAVRPESLQIGSSGGAGNEVAGHVESVTYFGAHSDVIATVGDETVTARVDPRAVAALDVGDAVTLHLPPDALVVLNDDTRGGADSSPVT